MIEIMENFAGSHTGMALAFGLFILGITSHLVSLKKPTLKNRLFPFTVGFIIVATMLFATKVVGLKLGILGVASQFFLVIFASKHALKNQKNQNVATTSNPKENNAQKNIK